VSFAIFEVLRQAFLPTKIEITSLHSLPDGEPFGHIRLAVGILDKLFCLGSPVRSFLKPVDILHEQAQKKIKDEEEKKIQDKSGHSENPFILPGC